MKKVNLILPASAFVLAAGVAFASVHSEKPVNDRFIYIDGLCEEEPSAICEGEGATCTYEGQPVYEQKESATQCLNELERSL